MKSLFSVIVFPGMGGSPPVMILSGWPAVWVSIVKNVFENLKAIPPGLIYHRRNASISFDDALFLRLLTYYCSVLKFHNLSMFNKSYLRMSSRSYKEHEETFAVFFLGKGMRGRPKRGIFVAKTFCRVRKYSGETVFLFLFSKRQLQIVEVFDSRESCFRCSTLSRWITHHSSPGFAPDVSSYAYSSMLTCGNS